MKNSVVITPEKLIVYRLLKQGRCTNMSNPDSVVKGAWDAYGTRLNRDEACYIKENYEKLLKEFRGEKEDKKDGF